LPCYAIAETESNVEEQAHSPSPGAITDLLHAWSQGSDDARDRLIPLVYQELHRRASRQLRQERQDHTLEPGALVNEAYLRLVDQTRVAWQDRSHFFAVASEMMRRVLVDHARGRSAQKRGGNRQKVALDDALAWCEQQDVDVVALDEALTELAALDSRQARIVDLRFFGGLSIEETAEALGLSPATVKRDWRLARAWLKRRMASPAAD
jgi:RNA polymerase sigma factor (TIGR02999 family)